MAGTCYDQAPTPPASGISNPLPPIPVATDAASTMAAVNAIRGYLMAGQPNAIPANNTQQGVQQPFRWTGVKTTNKGQQNQSKNKGQGGFVEVSRQSKQSKITNPDNPDQYVMVNQITQLTMTDPVTGQTWIFEQGGGGS